MDDLENRLSRLEDKTDKLEGRMSSLENQMLILATKVGYLVDENRQARQQHHDDMRDLRSAINDLRNNSGDHLARQQHHDDMRELRRGLDEIQRDIDKKRGIDMNDVTLGFVMVMGGSLMLLSVGTVASMVIRSVVGG